MSKIEWTDTTWNPVIGCTPVSPGCLNCYAATMARRLEAMGKPDYAPRDEVTPERQTMPDAFGVRTIPATTKTVRIAEVRGGRAVFTGDVRCLPDRLAEPLGWKKPRMVFVNSMSDLFHGGIYGQDHDDYRWVEGRFSQTGFEFLCEVVSVIRLTPRHTYQILTKRPRIMADMWPRVLCKLNIGEPLPNVWLGCSVEDQKTADERIPHLLKCPAAVRFVSYEPALGPVDFTRVDFGVPGVQNVLDCRVSEFARRVGIDKLNGIDWIIVGGESGHDARPCDVEWARSVVHQCTDAGVPCFVKQLGTKPYVVTDATVRDWPRGTQTTRNGQTVSFHLRNRKGSDPSEWPDDLRVRQVPGGAA